jgi:hypothetical protein
MINTVTTSVTMIPEKIVRVFARKPLISPTVARYSQYPSKPCQVLFGGLHVSQTHRSGCRERGW